MGCCAQPVTLGPSTPLTEQMAAGDALLGQRGLHGRNGGGEDVRLLQHLRGMWPIQRAEHGAVVQLHPLVQLDYRELVPAGLGAPVFVLRSQTEAACASSSQITWSSPVSPFHTPQLVTVSIPRRARSIILTVTAPEGAEQPRVLTTTQFSECTTCTGPRAFLWTASWMMRPVTPSMRMIPMKLRSWCRSVLSVTTASRLGFRYCRSGDGNVSSGLNHNFFVQRPNHLHKLTPAPPPLTKYQKHLNFLALGPFSDCQIFIYMYCGQHSSTFHWWSIWPTTLSSCWRHFFSGVILQTVSFQWRRQNCSSSHKF